ncbi:MAG: NAD(P)-dependent oxidoreductase [Rhodospirillaceae bacterium]|jgi:3-hydroxyisobutyrate dehydrogenase-like beta-hydroxyacid dehydrogenase|nr:NAD(P)-dependent oxidoreductase [Rhodospirillaceae bacterium]MBT4046127.1 NAD(P)-dependent oxidoreductase [Rhodospirillaceae bacterium]MBT4688855.1 NAD(P)-dependent oxidoreductase [Rhodospirillaceae bacterium]MBT5079629.1 NAD(P)-dependent oxidoreductase [Rhodospirillaceae bacterium]MBT5524688.1 NAD(P)-dependent oxidoreductase [Rhodospirillaceae bacterium]
MSEKIAVIGMGQMGSAMARRLSEAQHDVMGFDINEATRQSLVDQGVNMADSLGAALAGRTTVLSSLPDPNAVKGAWMGEGGIIDLAEPGSMLVELSTIDPDTMREVGAAAIAQGHQVLDCPVSGSPNEAGTGKLVLLVGGEAPTLERAGPLFDLLGQTWQHTGAVGTAKVVKIVNNMMSMGNVLVASEAFSLGVAAGVDPQKLFDVISVSGGRSHHFTKRFPNALEDNFEPGFKMELGEKDLSLGVELGRAMKMPTPTTSLAREMYALALAEGYRGKDIVALMDMYREWARNTKVEA